MSFWSKVKRIGIGLLTVGITEYVRKGRGAKPRDAVDAIIEEAISSVLASAVGLGEYSDVEHALYNKLDGYGYNARRDVTLRHRINSRLPSAFAAYKRGQV